MLGLIRLCITPFICLQVQDVATAYTATPTMNFLREFFDMRIIWLPRSPDLSLHNFFLWDYVKDKVFAHNPTSVKELKVKITEVIHFIDV